MFSEKDKQLLKKKGIHQESIDQQLKSFKNGIDFVNLQAAVTPENGICMPDEEKINFFSGSFVQSIGNYSFTRFIPASGAASRMSKALFEAIETLEKKDTVLEVFLKENHEISDFINRIDDYPFFNDLIRHVPNFNKLDKKSVIDLLKALLLDEGLNYGNLPKGLLKFHHYPNGSRTAFEEHFIEASHYLVSNDCKINLHFTVSPEHKQLFTDLSEELRIRFKREKQVNFNISFSEQKPSTDTLAVNMDNSPFRNDKGELVFRPGGHGALLENLNDLEEEIVFIGNIDNIAPDKTKELRIRYKKLLGGVLIEKVQKVHSILERIEKGDRNIKLQEEIHELVLDLSPEYADKLNKTARDDFFLEAFNYLNRPIRICGMVKNIGEPGGGPFWVRSSDGSLSKQIIESSQIDLDNEEQKKIFLSSSHFNPVDLACYIRNFKSEKFNLMDYRDPEMAFISKKSQGGKTLKALELPGLWNGSMAGWLSWFVDVPIETFTPVKTVFDLLRKEHFNQ